MVQDHLLRDKRCGGFLAWQLASAFAIQQNERWPFRCATTPSAAALGDAGETSQRCYRQHAVQQLSQGWPLKTGASFCEERLPRRQRHRQQDSIRIEHSSTEQQHRPQHQRGRHHGLRIWQQQQQQQQLELIQQQPSAGLFAYWPPFFHTTHHLGVIGAKLCMPFFSMPENW